MGFLVDRFRTSNAANFVSFAYLVFLACVFFLFSAMA